MAEPEQELTIDEEIAEYMAAHEGEAIEEEPQDPEPQAQEEAEDPKMVPLATLLEERDRYNAKLSLQEQRTNDLAARLDKVSKIEDEIRKMREERSKPPPEPEPDYLDDPKAYIDHKEKTLVERLKSFEEQAAEVKQASQSTQQQIQQATQVQAILKHSANLEEKFAAKQNDYWQALQFARERRTEQLKLMMPSATEEQLAAQLAQEEFATAASLVTQGRNPAEFTYGYAKSLGYTAKQPKADDDLHDRRERAQGLGGSGAPSDIENLMDLEDDEFDKAMRETFGR